MAKLLEHEAFNPFGKGRAAVRRLRCGAACALMALLAAADGNAQNTPVLKVVDADSTGAVKWTAPTSAVSLRLPLEIESGEVKGLIASVDDFIAPNATRIRPTVTLDGKPANQPIDVAQKDRPILEIAAPFPMAGEYTSHLVLFYSGIRQKSVPLSVTRQRSEVTAQIEGLDTVTTTKWADADAKIRFTVRETGGQAIALYAPGLAGFALKEGDKVRKQADYEKIEVDCQPSTPPAKTSQAKSFDVQPLSERPCVIKILSIAQAGEYSGTIRLASSNGTPVSREVTVLVKTSGWVAAFWVFLGVLASFVIRRYTKEQRPMLQALRRVRYAEEDLKRVESESGPPAGTIAAVFAGLRGRLSTIERDLKDGTAQNAASASLDEMDKKIQAFPKWLTTGRRLDAVHPQSIVRAPRAKWEALADSYFLTIGATEDIAASLRAIESEITQVVIAQIDEIIATAEAYKNSHEDARQQIDQEVAPRLAKAKEEAQAGDWAEMTVHFREACLAYVRVLADGLNGILAAPRPPLGLDDVSWGDLRTRIIGDLALIQQETDPDRALEIYQDANRTFLHVVVGKLQGVISGFLTTGVSPEQQQQLQDALAALTAATLAAQKGDWDTARAEYQRAAQAVISVQEDLAKASFGSESASAGQAIANLGETVPPAIGMVTALAPVPLRATSTAQQISDLLDRYDLLLNVALLLIACVVGMSLLWFPDPVWGGWKAYTTALLWGLGLHQVAGSALDGFPAVVKKVTE